MSKLDSGAPKLTDQELEKRVKFIDGKSGTRDVSTKVYERNPFVAELAKRRARGFCQLCNQAAPFVDKHGNPYLETHHIIWLSEGGEDKEDNTAALCPNCHRKMHSLNLESDKEKLFAKVDGSGTPINN